VLVKGSRFMRMERVVDAISVAAAVRRDEIMLLMLAQWLSQDVRGFGVINYITLRTVLAAMTALIISFIAGPARDSLVGRQEDRAGGSAGRAANTSGEIGHADHGRCADPDFHRSLRRCCGAT
jgi:hypothetical protein